ncbi:hypothetical protein ACG4ZL_00260, partial [Serratia nematodiphila]
STMAAIFEPVYRQLIASSFRNDEDLLYEEFELRQSVRKQFGLYQGPKFASLLKREWEEEYDKIVRKRNYFWYLMKSGNYYELDQCLNTNVYEDRICYENRRAAQREKQIEESRKKRLQRKQWYEQLDSYKYWDLSAVEDEKQDDTWLIEYYNTPSTYKKYKRPTSYDFADKTGGGFYRKTVEPARPAGFYERLCVVALKLRNIIEILEDGRKKMLYSLGIRRNPLLEEFEMDRLQYQGNVEQNLGGDTNTVQVAPARNVVLTETEITQKDSTSMSNVGWSNLTSSDIKSNHDSLVNRWLIIGTYEW